MFGRWRSERPLGGQAAATSPDPAWFTTAVLALSVALSLSAVLAADVSFPEQVAIVALVASVSDFALTKALRRVFRRD